MVGLTSEVDLGAWCKGMSVPREGFFEFNDGKYWVSFFDGVPHRVGGPAVVDLVRGWECWYREGLLDRDGGPACVGVGDDGVLRLEWFQRGLLHCVTGPALVWGDWCEWWVRGVRGLDEQLCAVAVDPCTSEEELFRLCMVDDVVVRELAVNNPSCPEEGKVYQTLMFDAAGS